MPRATTSSVPPLGAPKMKSQVSGDHLHRHDAHVERHAGDADAVVGELADRARDVRAVAVEIDRVVVVPDEVARRDERDRPAPVRRERHVHDAQRGIHRTAGFSRNGNARGVAEGGVPEGHAGVEHGDDDVGGGAGLDVPGALHVERREVPLVRIQRIVRPQHRVIEVARLRVLHVAAGRSSAATASASAPSRC